MRTKGPLKPISQKRLELLRELRLKQGELRKLEEKLARRTMKEMTLGALVEPGRREVRLISHQRGRRAICTLCVW